MSGNIQFNPNLTTNAAGGFNVSSAGLIQGTADADPSVRFALAGGSLSPNETLPMWGGVGIFEFVPPPLGTPTPLPNLGGSVGRALSLTGSSALTGFSVFDQNWAAINTPQSPVPLAAAGMLVNFYRLGSGARIAVAIDPQLVSLEQGIINAQVSWDFNQQRLVPYVASYPANVLTGASWSATSGGQVTFTTTTSHGVAVGDDFTIAGMTPAGYNGDFTAITGTSGSTLVAALATNPGSETVLGTLVAGGGALACKIIDVQIGNCMTVSYNAATGQATWNTGGSAAVIVI